MGRPSIKDIWGDLIGMGNLEDHMNFGALYPQFGGSYNRHWRPTSSTARNRTEKNSKN